MHSDARGYATVEELFVHANLVVEGRVAGETKGEAVSTEDGVDVARRVNVDVEQVFFSDLDSRPRSILVTDGGWQDDKQVVIRHAPQMEIGQRFVLFLTLTHTPGDEYFVQLAGTQGRFMITESDVIPVGVDNPVSDELAQNSPEQLRDRLTDLGIQATEGRLADDVERARAESQ